MRLADPEQHPGCRETTVYEHFDGTHAVSMRWFDATGRLYQWKHVGIRHAPTFEDCVLLVWDWVSRIQEHQRLSMN